MDKQVRKIGMNTTHKIIAFVVMVLLLSLVVISGQSTKEEFHYSDEELQALYDKYDITENDLKFARGELPNYLNGTILSGDKIVVVTENGVPTSGMVEGVDYDIIISEQEMIDIIEYARNDYISKYGVDPDNPKLDSVSGYLLPVQEANRQIMFGKIDLNY